MNGTYKIIIWAIDIKGWNDIYYYHSRCSGEIIPIVDPHKGYFNLTSYAVRIYK